MLLLDRTVYRSDSKAWGGERETGLAKNLEPEIYLKSPEAELHNILEWCPQCYML